jgi:hypothetical protein
VEIVSEEEKTATNVSKLLIFQVSDGDSYPSDHSEIDEAHFPPPDRLSRLRPEVA